VAESHTNTPNYFVVWRCVALVGMVLVFYTYVGRFVLPGDLLPLCLGDPQTAVDQTLFSSGSSFYFVSALSAIAALWLAASTLAESLRSGGCSAGFAWSSSLAAMAGIGLAGHQAADGLGCIIMVFYWWGFGLLWLFTNAVALWAWRTRSTVIARDWTIYSVGLAFVPVTALPQIPLWLLLETMDVHAAALTAVTSSFAAHYLIGQFCILELLETRSTAPA